jgi:cation diffusion facilitator family transporter
MFIFAGTTLAITRANTNHTKAKNNMPTAEARAKLGRQSGIVVLVSNLVLFALKYLAGLLSNSVAIRADAVNNLTDTVSAILTIVGFHISVKPKDKKHPLGYGRMEYISGLAISAVILVAGALLVKSSVERIISPEPILVTTFWIVLIPLVAVFVKLGLAYYSYRLNKVVKSATIKAVFKDCLFDAGITVLTLVTLAVSQLTSFPIDAVVGLMLSAVIIYNGFTSAKENVALLLGNPLDARVEQSIRAEVLKYKEFSGVSEIIMNDFGPNSRIVVVELLPNSGHSDAALQSSANKLSATFEKTVGSKTIVYWRQS